MRVSIETGRCTVLDPPKGSAAPFRVKPFGFRGEGQLTHDWKTIREMAYFNVSNEISNVFANTAVSA